jgi:hypothetical protein
VTNFIEAFRDVIEAFALGKSGEGLFIMYMPAQCRNGILIRPPIAGVKIDQGLPGFRRSEYKVIVRGDSYTAVGELAELLIQSLSVKQVYFDRFYVRYVHPATEPIFYPRGDSGLFEASMSFEVCYSDPTSSV